ncbi:MAG TPA: preprotein translocase subunit SecA [Armatimonadota bacterium]|nr:preprotein translocase subunit SecA [Armatimonadota bacterium]
MSFLKSLLDGNEREVARLRKVVTQINALEPQIKALSDEALSAKTVEFRERLKPYMERLDEAKAQQQDAKEPAEQAGAEAAVKAAYAEMEGELLRIAPEAFACVREAAFRTLKMRHFDVQMMAGLVLHGGRVAELATGEGKTLAATSPLYLNALTGKGSHLVTPNDYLAKRDAVWNAPAYTMLGLTVGVIQAYPYGSAYIYEPGYVADDPHMNDLRPVHRSECYECDIVYGTNAEFGFDYLRDNMARSEDEMVQRDLHFAIVDEMDSILIDEARTPLIISGMPEQSTDLYYRVDRVVARLEHERDYTLEEKSKNAMPTDEGIRRVEEGLGVSNLSDDVTLMHHVNASLKARFAYKRDVDYVVKDDEVIIVDEFTGRLMHGRRYSDGLHQAIEAKEGVKVEEETQTVATITIQNYFRLFHKLAGMTGTAKTEESEIRKIYGMDVVVVPTNLPMIRKDQSDVIYKTEEQKFRALVLELLQKHVKGQPVLVGTRSIEVSERLSNRLNIGERLQVQVLVLILRDKLLANKSIAKEQAEEFHTLLNAKLDDLFIHNMGPVAKALDVPLDALHPDNVAALKSLLELNENDDVLLNALENGIPHAVLNAKHHEREAEIVSEAGRKHAITIATNMAGRGVDIMLGGKSGPDEQPEPTKVALSSNHEKTYPSKEAAEVAELGGLAIIGSERHESRRIDRQLRGRSGRQGDPGETRFYLSLEDELWRLFGDRGRGLLGGWPEYEPLEARILTAAIERAQRKVEERNFGIRKHTLEYDDVMNVQRAVIYKQRREILQGAVLRDTILDHTYNMVEDAVARHCGSEIPVEEWELRGLYDELDLLFDLSLEARPADLEGKTRDELVEYLFGIAEKRYEQKEQEFEANGVEVREAERQITLQIIDQKWVEHLNAMEYLREGVWMRGFEQKDPLVIYKKEAYDMFNGLLERIQDDMVNWMFHLVFRPQPAPTPRRTVINPVATEDDLTPVAGPRANGPSANGPSGNGAGKLPAGSRPTRKAGRNDPCPCGSGKKYKFCCLKSGAL